MYKHKKHVFTGERFKGLILFNIITHFLQQFIVFFSLSILTQD